MKSGMACGIDVAVFELHRLFVLIVHRAQVKNRLPESSFHLRGNLRRLDAIAGSRCANDACLPACSISSAMSCSSIRLAWRGRFGDEGAEAVNPLDQAFLGPVRAARG